MLQTKFGPTTQLKTYGFLLAVKAQEGVNLKYVKERLAGSITFVEGVGKVEVELLGEIDCYDEKEF